VEDKYIIRGSGGGGKGGGGEARQAVEDPDTLHSAQYAKVVDAISEGEIYGLVDGHRSIFFNETALLNGAGKYNFDGVETYENNVGTQNQPSIPGFGGIRGQIAVSIEVKRGVGAPGPVTINQGNLDAISVTLSISQLTKQDKDDGDIHGAKVEYSVQTSYDGTNYKEVVASSFDGKTTTKYTREHRIELWKDKQAGAADPYTDQVSIKVVRVTKESTDSATQDSFFWESYTKIIDNKLTYPNTALMGVRINARQFSSIPKRAYHIRGIKCRVPHNYTGYEPTSYCTSRSYTTKADCTGIVSIDFTSRGSGYTEGDIVTFSAPTAGLVDDKTAEGTVLIGVISVSISAAGEDYVNGEFITFSAPDLDGGETAEGSLEVNELNQITNVIITNKGSGYTSAPTIDFDIGGGSGGAGTATIGISDINITEPGVGYVADGTIITIAGGSGAVATANRGGTWVVGVQKGDVLYEGYFNGTMGAPIWTSNPVWIYYDLLTNKRYGLGEYIQEDQIDIWSLYQISRYCDAVDSNGAFVGVKSGFKLDGNDVWEPRFATNVYIQEQQEAIKVMQDLAFAFRGMSYWAHGQLVAVQDSPKEPTQLFTPANTIGGDFTYAGTAQKARKTVALVSWNDPKDFFKRKIEYVEDREGIQRYGIRKTDITSFGCTSRGQAHRIGLWTLFTDTLETETLTFKAGIEAAVLQPGELIKVADPTRSGNRYGGRIKTGSTKGNIILDSPLTIPTGTGFTLNVIHTEDGCLHPQETAPGVAHINAGELYIPDNPTAVPNAEACISDGGQWSPYMFIENYPVDITANPALSIDIKSEISTATAGTGNDLAIPTGVDIFDATISFSHKFLGRTITNLNTSATAVIDNVLSSTHVTVNGYNGFAAVGDSLEYHHELTNTPNADYMWLLEEIGIVEAQVWRVLGVKEAKKHEYEVIAMEYHADKYRIIEEGLDFEDLDEISISRIPNITEGCPAPSDLDIYEAAYRGSDGSIKNKAIIRWQPPVGYPFVRLYTVEYRVNAGVWVDAGDTAFLELEVLDAIAGDYEVRVTAQSVLTNNVSPSITFSTTLIGLAKAPSSVGSYCESSTGSTINYLKTSDECTSQGSCSNLPIDSVAINVQTVCESTVVTELIGGIHVPITDDTKCGVLGHYWDTTNSECKGLWNSDNNVWVTNLDNFTVTNDPITGTYLTWKAVPDLDLHYYELRMSMLAIPVWETATTVTKTTALSYGGASGLYLLAGTHNYLIKAIDTSTVESAEAAITSTTIIAPGNVSTVSSVFSGPNVTLNWTKAPNPGETGGGTYNISDYEIRYGTDWASSAGTGELTGGASTITIPVTWGSESRKFWIAARDKAGNYSTTPKQLEIIIELPSWTGGDSTAWPTPGHVLSKDSLVLTWAEPDNHSLPIENYEVRRGATAASATTVGTFKTTTYTLIVDWLAGTESFWVKAFDSANNESQWRKQDVRTDPPLAVNNLSNAFVGPDLVLTWDTNTSGASYDAVKDYLLDVHHWIITDPDNPSDSFSKFSPRFSIKVDWLGNDKYYDVEAVDSAGNVSTPDRVHIDVKSPGQPVFGTNTITSDSVILSWGASTGGSLDIKQYILRKGYTWYCTYDAPSGCSETDGADNDDITKFLGLTYSEKVDWGSDHYDDMNFFVVAEDEAGNISTKTTFTSAKTTPDIDVLTAPIEPNETISGKRTLLTWTAPTTTAGSTNKHLGLDVYEIWGYPPGAKGTNPLELLKTTKSTSYSEDVTWKREESTREFIIKPIDMAGQVGEYLTIEATVPIPDKPGYGVCSDLSFLTKQTCEDASAIWSPDVKTLTSVVVDNNVLLRWGSSSNTDNLDIESYEVKRCPDGNASGCVMDSSTWASLVSVANTAGQFIAHMETTANDYKYGIVAIDSAGNYSEISEILASVSEPPDFVLQGEFTSTLDEDNPIPVVTPPAAPEVTEISFDNIYRGAFSAFLPVDTTTDPAITWKQHFDNAGVSTFQNLIDAGYPYYLQPSGPLADTPEYWQEWDIGVSLDSSNVSLAVASVILGGSITLAHNIYYTNSDPTLTDIKDVSSTTSWIAAPAGSSAAIGVPFRYIKVKTMFNGSGSAADLMSLDEFRLKLSIKTITDSADAIIDNNSGICDRTGTDPTTGTPYSHCTINGVYNASYTTEETCSTAAPNVGVWNVTPYINSEGVLLDNNQAACALAGAEAVWTSTRNGLKVRRVFFNKAFKDVRNVVATIKLGVTDGVADPITRKAIADFVDVPNPEFFYVHIIDTAIYNTGSYDTSWVWTDSLIGDIKSFNGTITWNSTGTK
jgi:predicted phage tail protein